MNIEVNKEILKEAILNLEKNSKFFVINENLFSIDKINTLLKLTSNYETFKNGLFDETKFQFEYGNDKIIINYFHEDTSCQKYTSLCKLISEDEIKTLAEKSYKIVNEKYKGSTIPSLREVDEIFRNEVLVFISSKINEVDKNSATDDFISKYDLFKEKLEFEIKETIDLMNKLYKMLLNIKLEK